MSLPIRILIFPLQYLENKITGPGINFNSFINSSYMNNNSVSTLNFVTNNGYSQYIFENTSYISIHYTYIENKIKPATGKKKLIYLFLQIFRTLKKCTKDRNINFHHITLASNYSTKKCDALPTGTVLNTHISNTFTLLAIELLCFLLSSLAI